MLSATRAHLRVALTLALLGGSCTLAPAIARADAPTSKAQAQARAKFEEGQRAFAAGDFRRAGEAFEAAYALAPHHSPLWNAARAWERAGELAHAANLYARYLREAPAGAPDRDRATASLKALAQKLARVEVHVDGVEDAQIDGTAIDAPEVWVTPGDHAVSARANGQTVRKPVHVEAGDATSVALEPPAPEPPATSPSAPPEATPASTPPTKDATTRGGWSPAVVVVGGAATAVLGGLAIWSGLDTLSQKDAFDQSPTQSNLDDGRSKEARTNVLIGAAAVAGVFTAVAAIFLVDWHARSQEPPDSGQVTVGVGPGSVVLGGRF